MNNDTYIDKYTNLIEVLYLLRGGIRDHPEFILVKLAKAGLTMDTVSDV